MDNWFDFSFLDQVISILNPDVLHVFGIQPVYIQFVLVFVLVSALRWVMLPVIEWLMIKQWSMFLSYVGTVMVTLMFLQLVDRYAMGSDASTLPVFFWPVSLLAVSGYGALYIFVRLLRKTVVRIINSKKTAA
ncbi:hypothetical protein MUN89_14975 [Halobacillus salinarum]|uniref:Uncharacterized protein n=1 Tax=Halobacillus salinarum TaxID=2932257 RepID=A0ABY4EGG4_9BACI|nr:hypothetical protein [Halobacillus salinarum]UOQ43231.1 hypothetical protein MUN89_14975 [Halobacillus salinarum]